MVELSIIFRRIECDIELSLTLLYYLILKQVLAHNNWLQSRARMMAVHEHNNNNININNTNVTTLTSLATIGALQQAAIGAHNIKQYQEKPLRPHTNREPQKHKPQPRKILTINETKSDLTFRQRLFVFVKVSKDVSSSELYELIIQERWKSATQASCSV